MDQLYPRMTYPKDTMYYFSFKLRDFMPSKKPVSQQPMVNIMQKNTKLHMFSLFSALATNR